MTEAQLEKPAASRSSKERFQISNPAPYTIYAVALAVSISIWLIAIRAPLFLDETGSYWMIKDGFSQIWPRQYLGPPVYYYILWLWAKTFGTSELVLRSLSVLAMLGAVYLFYRVARELFERDIAFIATVIFCLHPIVIFESIDVRPYAFAVLAVNAAIFALLRLRHNDSNWLPTIFGLLAAIIVYFHYLFATILPALALCFFLVKRGNPRTLWRQFGIATAALALAFLPLIPGILDLFRTSGIHVYEKPPTVLSLLWTLAPDFMSIIIVITAFVAFVVVAATPRRSYSRKQFQFESWPLLVGASLAFIPVLILYGVSAGTSIHMFAERHRLVAVPGIALCWAFIISCFPRRGFRLLFCLALVTATASFYFASPFGRRHMFTWKYAVELAQKNASVDNAPVVVCSDFPEADYVTMPVDSAKDSRFFAPLSYYKLTVPVIPLPRALNAEAIRVGSHFLQQAAQKHERFLALSDMPSYKTLDWLSQKASGTYEVRKLGVLSQIEVLEFTPRPRQPSTTPRATHSLDQPQ